MKLGARRGQESFDLQEARSLLDEDHRGLEKVKIRILEFLAVQKLRGLHRALRDLLESSSCRRRWVKVEP